MIDIAGLVALIVSAVALIIAGGQLTQQLLATGYVIRKCDSIVTGGLTKGGKRQWHWRQFRFTVIYQSVIFSLPSGLYKSLGLSPTVQVNEPASWLIDSAKKTRPRRGTGQACWVSFLQDLVQYDCITAEDVCLKEESADRVPDDLTVAPTRVDAMTILLSCIAMGMQVFKYSPTTGEVTLGGGCGSISSSAHPVLGGLLRYSVFLDEPSIGIDRARLHSRALRNIEGVWANAVFGLFRNRAYRPEYFPLTVFFEPLQKTLAENGWPSESTNDTIGGAACFLAFANLDCYLTVPPSVVRPWCAHFAETILKIEHWEMINILAESDDKATDEEKVEDFPDEYEGEIDTKGYSSPHVESSHDPIPSQWTVERLNKFRNFKQTLLSPALIETLKPFLPLAKRTRPEKDDQDPSDYVPAKVAWEQILRLDGLLRALSIDHPTMGRASQAIVAKAIGPLAEVGAPSWQTSLYLDVFSTFPKFFESAVSDAFEKLPLSNDMFKQALRYHAYFKMLRACYFTIMMRSAHDIGPGLSEESKRETSLLYMA